MMWVRRTILSVLVLGLAAGAYAWFAAHEAALGSRSELSGWVLLGLMLLLTALNWRKKLSFLPIGRVYWWTQLHVYGGLLTLLVFALHVPGILPGGVFETGMAIAFLVVTLSGVFGIYISRTLPAVLRRDGEAVIYERLPALREQLLGDIQQSVGAALEELGATRLSDFYADAVHEFMTAPRDFWAHLTGSSGPERAWAARFDSVRGGMDEAEAVVLDEVRRAVEIKIGLDRQHARRTLLKRWLFLHVPLSYGLLVMVGLHVMLAYGYGTL